MKVFPRPIRRSLNSNHLFSLTPGFLYLPPQMRFAPIGILYILLFAPIITAGQEIHIMDEENKGVVTFKVGDNIGFKLKGFVFNPRRCGELTDVGETYITVNRTTYDLSRVTYLRHINPTPNLLLGILGYGSLFISYLFFFSLLIPSPEKPVVAFLVFLAIGIGALLVKDSVAGERVYLKELQPKAIGMKKNDNSDQKWIKAKTTP